MKGPTQELLDFVTGVKYGDLTSEVIHVTKRIFLDSIGVGIAALKTDKGRYAMALANRFGGPPEAAILGTKTRAGCAHAAFANGELINAMDYDANFFPTHAPPSVIPAPMAIGETVSASGKEMILSIAVGCELSLRLGMAIRGLKKLFSSEEGSEVGKIVGTKNSVSAVGVVALAGAMGAGRILKLDPQKMAHAVGLAVHFTPFPQAKWRFTPRMSMAKYVSAGWASMGEVTAVLLAEMGYQADTATLDGHLGYWRVFGGDKWDPEVLTGRLGQEWKIIKAVEYKPYPCCRDFHVALDCFIKIIDENKLKPTDIEKVRIQTHPAVTQPSHMTKEIFDHIDAQFSLRKTSKIPGS
jgi:2-methylcitrate dehydratase PrpD